MGAFCVFGVSRSLCRAKAEKKVPTVVGTGQDRRYVPIGEWAQNVKAMSAELFEGEQRAVKISPEFDAPQFCHDWISVSPSEVRNTKIMVRGPKTDENGKPILRNGAPVMTWHEYEKQAIPA